MKSALFCIGFFLTAIPILGIGISWIEGLSNQQNSILWIFLVIVFSGVAGGAVHSLENDHSHLLKTPPKKDSFDTGVWGHLFIGVVGALLATIIAQAIFRFDLTPILVVQGNEKEALSLYLYATLTSIIGGYSGLPIISKISNAAIDKLEKEVSKIKSQSSENSELVSQLQKENEELKLQSLLLTAEAHLSDEEYLDAINIFENKVLPKDPHNSKAYIKLGFCYKRLGNLSMALEKVNQSLKIRESSLGYYNLACYQSILNLGPDLACQSLRKAKDLTPKEEYKKLHFDLESDPDFDNIKKQECFTAIKSELQ